jgi:mannose-1-phosphate guanylyltransferase
MHTLSDSSDSDTVALVFCGGEGRRLQPLSFLIRKEMLPIGRNRKPLLEFVVAHLRKHGFRNIVFLGSREDGGDAANYFGNGRAFGVNIIHQPDDVHCGGTGHALLWAIHELDLSQRTLLVYYGDMLTTVDLREFLSLHEESRSAATLAVSEDYRLPKGIAFMDAAGKVERFSEKPLWPGPGRVGIGLLCLDRARLLQGCGPLPSTSLELQRCAFRDVMCDIVPHLVERSTVGTYITRAPWLDIGSFESYDKVRKDVAWFSADLEDMPVTKRGLSLFLSYHISKENKLRVEQLLAPSLEAAGIRVVCGGQIGHSADVGRPVGAQALAKIDEADALVAIGTPDTPDGSPSDYVKDEVAYAHGKGKLMGLFVQKGTTIPEPWKNMRTWIEFEADDSGLLIRDVLQRIAGAG